MDQKALVSEICDQADSLLAGVATPKEAKESIGEWLTIHRPTLSPDAKRAIIAQAMDILDREGFFELEAGS